MRLEGACAILTGAGSGIGRALTLALAAKGARLALADLNHDAVKETASLISGERFAFACNVASAKDRAALHDAVKRNFGRLDLLINNAGVIAVGPVTGITDESIRAMMDVNLLAPMAMAREFAGLLEESAPSLVVNIGSMFGDIAFPLFAAYSATKFGVRGFSDALRREFHGKGISVAYVAPRATRTKSSSKFDHLAKPFKMTFDSPESVAANIVAGIESGKRAIYPRGPERLFAIVQCLFPGIIDKNIIPQLANIDESLRNR